MDKMRFESANLTAANIDKIAELFPGVVTEGKVNFDLLRSLLGDEVYGDEAYEFTWVGKRAAIAEAGRPIRKTLRPCPEESKNWDTTENLYIEGDNLDVLKLLQESYLGKVKIIYIDPPYNTGNDFVYRDNFTRDKDEYEEEAGVYDEDGDRLFRNTESNGRFHSDWCSMMYPRLLLARNLLRNDGVIFISIDDNEIAQLRKICDEVFGESNFVADLCVVNNLKGRNDKKYIARANERMLMYVKSQEFDEYGLSLSDNVLAEYNMTDSNGKYRLLELRKRGGPDTRSERPNMYYPFYVNPDTGEVSLEQTGSFSVEALPVKSNGVDGRWRWGKETAQKNIGFLYGRQVGNKYNIYEKDYYESDEGARRIRPKSVLAGAGYSTDVATKEYRAIMQGIDFSNPKPVLLLRDLIEYAVAPEESSIILDFFSGSATTAHAVMQLNAEDGGKRKFIMVQLPEPCPEGSEAAKAGYKNICEIGKERIRRAGEKIKDEAGLTAQNLDIGFRVLKLDDTNMKDVYYAASEYTQDLLSMMEDNIKDDRTDMDLLYACLLDWGLPLSMPHTQEKIGGFTVHTYNDGDLIACFDKQISDAVVKEIARRQPLRAVFRDSSFAGSPEKINVEEIFKLLAPNTSVRVI
ncbi:putative methyltransferase [Pelotomaculum schinkii]|uniref:Putative methyltransferase n=1 Tax=Pelotomaculum schinkii TaxID=78350 RepID=A0A4Y7RI27_9FIRM|nr:site-specific DNA-methyltransferase [Pelotomaculum schinkii]TEB08352.1 putative methyltransferase [Pelotomaculum schinkii]